MKFRYLIVLLLLLPSIKIIAQDALAFPIAAYGLDGGLYVFGLEAEPILLIGSDWRFNPFIYSAAPVWSADGMHLAYQDYQDEMQRHVFISSIHDLASQMLIAELELGSHLAFTADSQNLLYSRLGAWEEASNPEGFEHGTWQDAPLTLEASNLATGTVQSVLTNALPTIHGIDVERRDDIELACAIYRLSIIESRWTHLAPLILADTPYGIVSYFNQTLEYERLPILQIGESFIETPSIANASFSPDFEELAFTVGGRKQIGRVDLASQAIETYETSQPATAILGDGQGFLYYSVQIEGEELLMPDGFWEEPRFLDYLCNEHINQVIIYQFDIETGLETLLYSVSAHSIPWMSLAPDGQSLYFTMIPNGEVWREKILKNECLFADCLEYVFPSLYRLDMVTLESELVLENVLKPVINYGYTGQ